MTCLHLYTYATSGSLTHHSDVALQRRNLDIEKVDTCTSYASPSPIERDRPRAGAVTSGFDPSLALDTNANVPGIDASDAN